MNRIVRLSDREEGGRCTSVFVAAVLLVAVGCGEPSPVPTDAGLDGSVDAGGPIDAGGGVDARAPIDGGVDGDGDGVSIDLDCDDTDPGIGRIWTRSCESDCDPAASQNCTDGVWGECETGAACLCPMAGATRVVDCAMCGTRGQACTAGMWVNSSACLGGGECEAGAVEERSFSCGRSQRICGADCGWGEWVVVEGMPAVCEPGVVECRPREEWRWRACTDACMWRLATEEDCDAA